MKPTPGDSPVYDMYPWNQKADADPWNQKADASDEPTEAVRAVQVALDRRDNGGEASAHAGPVTQPRQRGTRGK